MFDSESLLDETMFDNPTINPAAYTTKLAYHTGALKTMKALSNEESENSKDHGGQVTYSVDRKPKESVLAVRTEEAGSTSIVLGGVRSGGWR